MNPLEAGGGLLVTALDMTTSFQTGDRWMPAPSTSCWNQAPGKRHVSIFPMNSSYRLVLALD